MEGFYRLRQHLDSVHINRKVYLCTGVIADLYDLSHQCWISMNNQLECQKWKKFTYIILVLKKLLL